MNARRGIVNSVQGISCVAGTVLSCELICWVALSISVNLRLALTQMADLGILWETHLLPKSSTSMDSKFV